jgi:RNA polymerase-binding transcription factor DksA
MSQSSGSFRECHKCGEEFPREKLWRFPTMRHHFLCRECAGEVSYSTTDLMLLQIDDLKKSLTMCEGPS